MEMNITTLNNEDIARLDFLGDFYGLKNRAILMKLALRKYVKEHFAQDTTEQGQDQDLEEILVEEK